MKAASAASDTGFRTTPNKPAGAGEIALPQGMAGIAFQRRDAARGRLRAAPAASAPASSAGFLMRASAAPAGCEGRAGPGSNRRRWHRGPDRHGSACSRAAWLSLAVTVAQHHIGMAADIFGRGLDGEIHAMGQRLEEQRRRPGIVHQHGRAMRVGRLRRWRECPAPRRSASRGFRRTPPWCWASDAARCRRRGA